MISTSIVDPVTGKMLKVNGEGEISVTMHTHPPLNEEIESYPYSSWFENSGSNDLRVDGSTTPASFSIDASPTKDIFIKTISVRISDAGATLGEFGNLAALTNGISFTYETPATGVVIIQDEIKTNLDFIRVGINTPATGGGTDAFKADLTGGGADTYLPVIDLNLTFGYQWGLRLTKNTKSSLSFIVNDDLSTGIDAFNIKGFGIQI